MKDTHKRRAFLLTGVLAVLVCAGVIVGQNTGEKQALETSAEYVEYENNQIAEHDGEVLVDSINISMKKGDGENVDGATTPAEGAEGAAGVVTSDDLSDVKDPDSYYNEVRASINLDRDEILTMLTAVIDEAEEGAEKENATQQKLKIIDYMNKESEIEGLIENKGFANVLALITDSSVTVTVDKQDLSMSEVAQITDIVMRETGRSADQIVIQSKL